MKINLLVYSISLGGAELHTIGLASRLSNRGHRVRIIEHGQHCYAANRDLLGRTKIEILNFPWALQVPFHRYGEFLRKHRADVGVLIKGLFSVGGVRTDVVAWLCHRRFYTIEHALSDPMPAPGIHAVERRLRNAIRSHLPRRIICVSDAIHQRLHHQEKYPVSKLVTVHHGIDPMDFCPSESVRAEMRERWEIPQGDLVFGYVGRLSREKGAGTAINAFSRLQSSALYRDSWLVLAGEGDQRESLERAATAKNLGNRIRFIGFQRNPQTLYPAFDFLLVPSTVEGFGLSLLEGMACGCPGIAMNVGGIPEVLSNPDLGWLVPPGDEGAFGSAMIHAASLDQNIRREMGDKARQHALQHYDLNHSMENMIDIIEESKQL